MYKYLLVLISLFFIGCTSSPANTPSDITGNDGITCESGQHIENGVCVSNVRTCSISGGRGEETWSSGSWGSCTVVSCDSNFEQNGNTCDRFLLQVEVHNYTAYSKTFELNGDLYLLGVAKDLTEGLLKLENGEFEPVIDMGTYGPEQVNILVQNNKLYMIPVNGTYANNLVVTDGTLAGTSVLDTDVENQKLVKIGTDKVLFACHDSNGNNQPCITDGVTVDLVQANPLVNDSVGIQLNSYISFGSGALFLGNDGSTGFELWETDGTVLGTSLITDLKPGSVGQVSSIMIDNAILNDEFYFAGDSGSDVELYKYDGLSVSLVKDININVQSAPHDFQLMNSIVYFVADDDTGEELWKTDGTNLGTVKVVDLNTQSGSGSDPELTKPVNSNTMFFEAVVQGETTNKTLHVTDGTSGGTVELIDIRGDGTTSAYPRDFAELNGEFYFVADTASGDSRLIKSDKTKLGTSVYSTIDLFADSISDVISFKDNIWFNGNDNGSGLHLFKTSGDGNITKVEPENSSNSLETKHIIVHDGVLVHIYAIN